MKKLWNKINSNKTLKYSLFFGFYFFFFLFLFIYLKNNQQEINHVLEEKKANETYSIKYLLDNDYNYMIEVESDETKKYNGSKTNIDYSDSPYQYFFDIYNINQLLKKAKIIEKKENIYELEITNKELNELLNTEKIDGNNQVHLKVDNLNNVNEIDMDLTNYYEGKVLITLKFERKVS